MSASCIKANRGQAAMEFLMTYGWAILVVLVVIGALSYFGVLSPATLLPEKCTFPVSVSCTDHSVSTNTITLRLQNGAGRDMVVYGASATSEALRGGLGCNCNNTAQGSVTLRNGATSTFTLTGSSVSAGATCDPDGAGAQTSCDFVDSGRDKNRYNITILYAWLDSTTIKHALPGEMLARRP